MLIQRSMSQLRRCCEKFLMPPWLVSNEYETRLARRSIRHHQPEHNLGTISEMWSHICILRCTSVHLSNMVETEPCQLVLRIIFQLQTGLSSPAWRSYVKLQYPRIGPRLTECQNFGVEFSAGWSKCSIKPCSLTPTSGLKFRWTVWWCLLLGSYHIDGDPAVSAVRCA